MTQRTYTVAELILDLQTMPQHARVCIVDPDTLWTISEFGLSQESRPDVDLVWINPCDYRDMNKEFGQ